MVAILLINKPAIVIEIQLILNERIAVVKEISSFVLVYIDINKKKKIKRIIVFENIFCLANIEDSKAKKIEKRGFVI